MKKSEWFYIIYFYVFVPEVEKVNPGVLHTKIN